MKKSLLLLSFLSLFLVVGCADKKTKRQVVCHDGELKDFGIIGGRTVSKDSRLSKSVIAIITTDFRPEYGETLCTGVLLDENTILTAAHCVSDRKDDQSVKIAFSVAPVCEAFQAGKHELLRLADKFIIHEKYGQLFNKVDDIALIRFKGKAPEGFLPMALATEKVPFTKNQKIYLSGYGKETNYNDKSAGPVRLKVAEVAPYMEANSGDAVMTKNNFSQVMHFDQRNGQGACAGDSGGPALLRTHSGLKVLGIASKVAGINKQFLVQDDVNCTQSVEYSSVYHYRDWIRKNHAHIKAL